MLMFSSHSLITSLLSLEHVSTIFVIFVALALFLTFIRFAPCEYIFLFTPDLTTAIPCTIVSLNRRLIVFRTSKNAHAVVAALRSSNPGHILSNLQWIKIQERIKYKVISTTYKLLQSSSPRCLRDLVTVQPSCPRCYQSSWSDNINIISFYYPNMTTLRSGICYRKSVGRLSAVCNVRAPTKRVANFGNISSPFCTLAIL